MICINLWEQRGVNAMVDTNIDRLLQAEKQKLDEQRNKQKRLIKIASVCILAIIVVISAISTYSFYKSVSKQNFITAAVIILVGALLSGLVETIKYKKTGKSKSAIAEVIHLVIFALMFVLSVYMLKY